jgi:hypothetical protein
MSVLWGWIGIILIIVATIVSSVSGAIIVDPKRDNNTWHHVAAWAGLIFAVIGIFLVIFGFRSGCPKAPKGFMTLILPETYGRNIKEYISNYEKGGEVPCFAKPPTSLVSRFKGYFSSSKPNPGPSSENPFR